MSRRDNLIEKADQIEADLYAQGKSVWDIMRVVSDRKWQPLTDEGDVEWVRDYIMRGLRDARRREICEELPRVSCCDLGKQHIAAFHVPYKKGEEPPGFPAAEYDEDGAWVQALRWCLRSVSTRYEDPYQTGQVVAISFCPFCGQKMKPFKLRTNPPPHVHQPDWGGDYCGHCKERARSCYCSSQASLYEEDVA